MKKFVVLLLALAMDLSLAACGGSEKAPEVSEITVTFMNNDDVLGTVTANAGEVLTGYEQFENLEGNDFNGWFETPGFVEASKKDLSTATFDADITLFGNFTNNQVAEDTREWFIVGDGTSPVLKNSKWAGDVDAADKEACKFNLTGNATNEFSITLDLYNGDKFQVIHDWQWDGQKGFGRFKGIDAECFENGGGLSGDNNSSDVCVIKDGNYTITLTTDPEHFIHDVMTIERNGDPTQTASEVQVEDEPYVPGEGTQIVMKGSWVADWSENIELEKVGEYIFTVDKELEAGTELYFMVWDNGTDTGIGMNQSAVMDLVSLDLLVPDAYNVTVLEAGNYNFTVDAKLMTITVTKY